MLLACFACCPAKPGAARAPPRPRVRTSIPARKPGVLQGTPATCLRLDHPGWDPLRARVAQLPHGSLTLGRRALGRRCAAALKAAVSGLAATKKTLTYTTLGVSTPIEHKPAALPTSAPDCASYQAPLAIRASGACRATVNVTPETFFNFLQRGSGSQRARGGARWELRTERQKQHSEPNRSSRADATPACSPPPSPPRPTACRPNMRRPPRSGFALALLALIAVAATAPAASAQAANARTSAVSSPPGGGPAAASASATASSSSAAFNAANAAGGGCATPLKTTSSSCANGACCEIAQRITLCPDHTTALASINGAEGACCVVLHHNKNGPAAFCSTPSPRGGARNW